MARTLATRRTTRRSLPLGMSRIDQPATRTHGYFIRLGYHKTSRGWRPRMSAFFGDATYGGKAAAMRAAERWLKTAMRSLAKQRKARAA